MTTMSMLGRQVQVGHKGLEGIWIIVEFKMNLSGGDRHLEMTVKRWPSPVTRQKRKPK